MDIPVKTLKSGFSLPVYGLGTFMMGGRMEIDMSNDAAEIAAIKAAIDHGITHIDTAEVYGAGHCEELVGEAIQGYDRSKLIITSKVKAGSMAGGFDGVVQACKDSLARLGTDYIDLYLLHRYPDPGVSIEEVMRALDYLIEQGLVKHIGACNLTIGRFEEAQKHAKNKLVCNQVEYSLQIREAEERGIIEYCQTNDIFIMAWGPLDKGVLEQADILREMADKYNKTAYQVALNWLLSQPNVVTIPKTTQVEHLEENLGALGWAMGAEDVLRLTEEFPNQKLVSTRVPLDYPADIE